jgi:hypothetical protein
MFMRNDSSSDTVCDQLVRLASAVALATATVSLAQGPAGLERADSSTGWSVPRTSYGHPDLEGVWDFSSLTPLERPTQFSDRAFMTADEAAVFERDTLAEVNADRRGPDGSLDLRGPAINEFWLERGTLATIGGRIPTSLLVDPPDGRVPAPLLTRRRRGADVRFDTVADFALSERCLRSAAGPPALPGAPDGNLIRITQSRDLIAIVQEKFNDPRIVSLDGRPHLPQTIRSWVGDSIGRWEGETLVVDTTNFTHQLALSGRFDGNLHLVERFTLIGPDTLLYEFTVDDPTAFAQPWTVRLPMKKTTDKLYEYACHEGNYALPNILRGARVDERR